MKMKKILCGLIAVTMFVTGALPAFAGENTPYNWYCKNNNDHSVPQLDEQQQFIEQYDGYYVNHKVKKGDKVIYLTFDAGYENGNVARIMDALKAHHAQGAFFILDNLIVRNGDLVKRMVEEGHLVCNHTKKHPDMTKISDKDTFAEQLDSLADSYKTLTGCEMPKIYRPPEGRYSKQNLEYAQSMGYKTVFWSFAYADWDNNRQMSEEKALEKILAHTHNGEIMLLHPTSSTNAAIMDRLLTKLEAEGYRFGSLNELWER